MFVHLKSIFFAPTFKGDEAKTRAVGQIHVIVLVMLASALLYTVIFPFANPAQAYRLYLVVPLYPLLLGVLFLVRRGWVRLSTTLLHGYWTEEIGKHFDPRVMPAFLEMLNLGLGGVKS